jgi:hypothetical protein
MIFQQEQSGKKAATTEANVCMLSSTIRQQRHGELVEPKGMRDKEK